MINFNFNAKNKVGNTPLISASKKNDETIVKLLLNNFGVNIADTDESGSYCFNVSCYKWLLCHF